MRVRGRQLSAEQRIMPVMYDLQIAAAGHQDRPQTGLAYAVHGVKCDPETGTPDRLRIHQGKDAVDIVVGGILLPHQSLPHRFLIIEAPDAASVRPGDRLFDPVGYGPVRIPAAGGKDLDTVIDGRVVACRDHESVRHVSGFDRIHDQWGGRGAVDHQHTVSAAGKHLRQPVCRFLGKEPAVISDTKLRAGQPLLIHQAAQARRQQTKILFCKAVGDNCPPAPCSELQHESASFFIPW